MIADYLSLAEAGRESEFLGRLLQTRSAAGVVATGVASPLAILAIAVARATHAPSLTYIACVGSLDPELPCLYPSSEDLRYLDGRSAEVTIPDLFDHARRGRVDTVFFGAAEVDVHGRTNMTASGSLTKPRSKFPGVAGASNLRRWVRRPVRCRWPRPAARTSGWRTARWQAGWCWSPPKQRRAPSARKRVV